MCPPTLVRVKIEISQNRHVVYLNDLIEKLITNLKKNILEMLLLIWIRSHQKPKTANLFNYSYFGRLYKNYFTLNQYFSKLSDKLSVIEGLFVRNSWDLKPLVLINVLALSCYSPSAEVWIICRGKPKAMRLKS